MDYEGGDLLAGWCCLCRLLGHWHSLPRACKMIVLAILTKSPLQRTSNTWPGHGELGVVTSYFDDDAVVTVRPDFQRDCGFVVQHLYFLLLVSKFSDLTVYRSGCTEIVHILNRSVYRSRMALCSEMVMYRSGPTPRPQRQSARVRTRSVHDHFGTYHFGTLH